MSIFGKVTEHLGFPAGIEAELLARIAVPEQAVLAVRRPSSLEGAHHA